MECEGNCDGETATEESQPGGSELKEAGATERDTDSENSSEKTGHSEHVTEPLEVFHNEVLEKIPEEEETDGNLVIGTETVPVSCDLEEANTFEVSLESANVVEVEDIIVARNDITPVSSVPVNLEYTGHTCCAEKDVSEKEDSVNDSEKESSGVITETNSGDVSLNQEDFVSAETDIPEDNETSETLKEEAIYHENTVENVQISQELNTPPNTENTEESFQENGKESLNHSYNSDASSVSNGQLEDTHENKLNETAAAVEETKVTQESVLNLDTRDIEKEFEENSKTLIEKLKILKGNLLARHIIREDSYSKLGSVDVDENADVEFERLTSEPFGKTLDEELRESEKLTDSIDGRVVEECPNSTDSSITETKTQQSDKEDANNESLVTKDLDNQKEETIAKAANLTMPETREDTDGCVSPSLMFASCRYRWEKTIVTESESVVFVTINNKDIQPLKLEWQPSSSCFYSEEFKIPVGTYVGHLVVDGAFYPVEDITVKHYTFEVDLFLKDDIIEDETEKTGVAKAEDFIRQKKEANGLEVVPNQERNTDTRYSPARANNYNYSVSRDRMEAEQGETTNHVEADSSIHLTSKYEDLVRSQLNHTKSSLLDTDLDAEINHSLKSDYSDLDGRRSPVGDDGAKQYQDRDETLRTADLEYGYRSIDDSGTQRERFNKSLVEDDVEQQSLRSGGSRASHSGHGSPAIIDDVLGSGHTRSPIYSTESPVHSRNNSAHSSAQSSAHSSTHSSARQTPTAAAPSPTRPESVGSNRSANSVTRHVLDDLIQDSVRLDQRSPNDNVRNGSGAVTPPPEQIGDVLNPSDRHSPIRREYFTHSPQMSNHSSQASVHSSPHGSAHGSVHSSPYGSVHSSPHGSAYNSAHSSQRQTPQRELISDSLKASQEKLYKNDEKRSFSGSQGSGSLPGSRPQSLTSEQELSQYYENDTEVRRTPVIGDGPGSRTGSSSSLPVIGTQRQTPDKRSMTPDNHIRVPAVGPIMKGPLLPGRTTPRTPLSNASSRTITPVNTPVNTPSEAIEQIRELETNVSNLRVMLAAKDQEVMELKGQFEEVKDINQKLQGDLDRHRARASPGQQMAELERKYRDAVDERERLSSEVVRLHEDLRQKDEPSLTRYNPNSPTALQRKIDELNSQIQDLHEVNESAVEERSALERKVKDLAVENETLRSTQSARLKETEDENSHLKSEIKRLKETQSGYSEVSDYRYRIELQQMKEDNRSLRDRNYQLHDDNLRLKEELTELQKSLELVSTVRRQYNNDGTGSRKMDRYEKVEDKDNLLETYNSDLGRHDYKTPGPDRSLSEERHKYSYKRSSRYEVKQEAVKVEKEYEADRFSKSDGFRHESYRVAGDGGTCENPTRPSPKYDPRLLTPERPSALGPARKDYGISDTLDKKYDLFERRDVERSRRDRNRTSSADLDFRSMPLSTYSDLSKITPALSGRSREIYQELSDKRAANKSKITENVQPQLCESEDIKPELESQTQTQTNSNSVTSKVFVNRYIPQTKESEDTPESDERKRLSAERMELSYAKSSPSLVQTRSQMEKDEKTYDPRPAEAFLDDGDMSDTPTDILVSVQPIDRIPSSTWARGHNRRGSVGSDASNSSFSDIDEQITASVRKRSKSADGREILRRTMKTNTLRAERATSAKGDKTLSRTLSPAPPTSGHRTVTPRPIATQHNKSALSLSSSIGSLTYGLRPFAPRSAGDLQTSDVIKFSRQGGKLSQGTIKFIGHLPGRGDIYLGVELDKEDGKHDGVFEGIRYFKCKPSKGVFVAYNKVVMAWTV